MTDIIFATLVLGAVILLGALITIGNERQRKAIDTLRQAAEDWAMASRKPQPSDCAGRNKTGQRSAAIAVACGMSSTFSTFK